MIGVPPELPFVYFVVGGTGTGVRRAQPGDGAQGLPAVANVDALQGVPGVDLAERGQDDQRTTQGPEGTVGYGAA